MPNDPLPDDGTQWQHLTDDDLVTDGHGDDPPQNDLGDETRHTGHSREMGLSVFLVSLLLFHLGLFDVSWASIEKLNKNQS